MHRPPLVPISGFAFEVQASRGAEHHARSLGARVEDARAWFAKSLQVPEAETYLLVLSPKDWNTFCPVPVFGVPYEDDGRGIIVGHGRAEFVSEFIDEAAPHLTPKDRKRIDDIFGVPSDATPYLDLVSVHELAHGVHVQGGWSLPRFWLYELWPQLAMVSYVASRRPDDLPVLDALHEAALRMPASALPASGLEDMGTSFHHGAWLYAWYEFRLGALARAMWDLVGIKAMQGFPTAFASEEMSDDAILAAFAEIHKDLPEMLLAWPGSP